VGLFRFGFRFRGRCFVGASPELLVARSAEVVRAEALAASLPRPQEASRDLERALANHLAGDAKQRREHELVVEALRAELEPLCRSLDVPGEPEVRVLRHLLHLSTPVTGHLASPVPLLELAARLHPTPAVAGKPRDRALEFVSRYEPHRRGWFAGPVGRVTLGGEGELAVALRSVLVSGNQAFVYAGAGIVAGSDAALELAETRAKARTCLAALGVRT
jgi:isochorismate synthase